MPQEPGCPGDEDRCAHSGGKGVTLACRGDCHLAESEVEPQIPQAGFEPATLGLEVRRSVQLSYWGRYRYSNRRVPGCQAGMPELAPEVECTLPRLPNPPSVTNAAKAASVPKISVERERMTQLLVIGEIVYTGTLF